MEQIQVVDFAANLNKVVAEYFEKLEKELNVNSVPYGDIQPGNLYNCYQIQGLAGVFRLPKSNVDAFKLPPYQAGHVKDVLIQDDDKNKILVRRLIGYTACSKIESTNDPKFTEIALKPLILEMLMSLEKELGFDHKTPHHGKYATFQRPGVQTGLFFRDMEDYAACELRLFSDTYPLINLKEEK
jgi:hypothetical protein